MEPTQQPQMPDYMEEYNKFSGDYKLTEISGEEIGQLIVRMGAYYGKYNMRLKNALRDYSIVMRDFQTQADPATGKAMSSTKAEVLASATDVAAKYEESKMHVANLEQYINALKSLMKGVLQEFSHGM